MKRSNATTQRLFTTAGISSGMTVLELGCGPGEVTELVSQIVGPKGKVLALDRSSEMIALAQKNLSQEAQLNVEFIQADLHEVSAHFKNIPLSSFDAIVGRRVLMYLSSPDKVLAELKPWLQKDGLVVFEEYDGTLCPGYVTPMPAHERATKWLNRMLSQEGVDQSMGFHLPSTYAKAGLKFDAIWAEAVIDGQGDQFTLGELLELMKPRLSSKKVATTDEVDELINRIEKERHPENVFVSGMRFCAKGVKS